MAPESNTFTYVRVPADDALPPEELSATTAQVGDALPDLLTPRFAGGAVRNVEGLRAEYGSAVDEQMDQLNFAASRGSVEVFPLVRPSPGTLPLAHAGTYFYFDEMGVLKGLPVNRRAAHIAASCGLDVESPFLGDVYIGRVRVQPSPMCNASFALGELDSSSEWLRSAPSANAQYQMAMADYAKVAKEKTAETTGQATAAAPPATAPGAGGAAASAAPGAPGSYEWSQTPEDLEVTLQLPAGCTKRDVKVELKPKHLKLLVKGEALAELGLFAAVRPDEMTYTFDAAKAQVTVMVEKADAVSWSRLEMTAAR